MTAEEYWHGDVNLPIAYRKANTMKRTAKNWELWMQGRYIYDAIIFAFSAEASQQTESGYLDEPYPITEEQAEERRRRIEKHQYEKDIATMKARMEAWNKKFEEGVVESG